MYDPKHPLCVENDKRELWFTDEIGNCYFFPKGWANDFHDDQEEDAELYGYYPTNLTPNSDVNNGWVLADDMTKLTEITEAEARVLHPALAAHLHAINAEE